MNVYLLCGYYPSVDEFPPVKILGLFETYQEATHSQNKNCGCIKKINKCWKGQNGMITWIIKSKMGLLEKALDIRNTTNAMLIC